MISRPQLRAGLIIALAFVGCAAATRGTAFALAEFCPATLSDVHAVGGDGSLFAATLGALSARSVRATVEAQTQYGWYAFPLPELQIAEQMVKYRSPVVAFVRNEPASPMFYMRLPANAGNVIRWWVTTATSSGDTLMGWDSKGVVTCAPLSNIPPVLFVGASTPAERLKASDPLRAQRVAPDPNDYEKMPAASDIVVNAKPGARQNLACPVPFVDASVRVPVAPKWPLGYASKSEVETLVRVAVDEGGNLLDAWVWQPSGNGAFDDAAVASARGSFYSGGRAFCAPAPGEYIFRAVFRP